MHGTGVNESPKCVYIDANVKLKGGDYVDGGEIRER